MDKPRTDLDLIAGWPTRAFALARDYPDGALVPEHHHAAGQLLHTLSGVLLAQTPGRAWAVPPGRALWIPPALPHSFAMRGDVRLRTLYVREREWPAAPEAACVVLVTPLVRELILRALDGTEPSTDSDVTTLVMPLLLAELTSAARENLGLPLPASPQLQAFADAVRRNPSDRRRLEDVARAHGLTGKTFQRRFVAETGMTPDAWRRHARLLEAVARLRTGAGVTEIALDLGYRSVSAFSQAFRASFGVSPGRARL